MVTNYIPTSAQDVEINAWFLEEVTPGVVVSNGTWKNIGILSTLDESLSNDVEEIPIVGSEDYYARVKMGSTKTFDMKYYLINDIDFISYVVQARAGTGTAAKSVSVLQKQKINGVSNYKLYRGCYPDSGTFNVERIPTVDLSYRAMSMTPWHTQAEINAIIGNTIVPPAALTATPLTNLDMGDDPFMIGATPFDLNSMTIGFNRNIRELKPLGQEDPTALGIGNRRISVDIETWVAGDAMYDFWNNFTGGGTVTIKFLLTPAVITLTLTDLTFEDYERGLDSGDNEFQLESLSGAAKSANLTKV